MKRKKTHNKTYSIFSILCEFFGGYHCPICGKAFMSYEKYMNCHKAIRERTNHVTSGGGGSATRTPAPTVSPYPGGPNGPAGFVPGGEYGGHYAGGSPYPGGPNGPAGFIPGSLFISNNRDAK